MEFQEVKDLLIEYSKEELVEALAIYYNICKISYLNEDDTYFRNIFREQWNATKEIIILLEDNKKNK